MKYTVSLIMAVYNGEAALRASIDSILTQTFSDFELVIVDDGSTDTTPAILSEYATRDNRVKIVKNQKNLGLTASLNVGIHAASGTYIARMDAGDTSEPTRFEQQVAFLDTHPECGLLGTWAKIVNEDGRQIGVMKYPTDHDTLRKIMIRYNPFVHSSVMMRRSVLDAAGWYDERWKYAQDYELFFRMLRHGKVALLGEYLVSYRVYPNSITRRKNKLQTLFAIKARVKAIRSGQYSVWSYIALFRPLIGYLLPYKGKQLIKKFI
jgi:glycosyltransferase involved in cell wall biosynthesis